MVASKLGKVGEIIGKAKEEIGWPSMCCAGELITLGIDKSDYFALGGGFWSTELGQWLANLSKDTIFEGGSYSEPYITKALAVGLLGLGAYLTSKNAKYAMIADELEKKLDNKEMTIDKSLEEILKKYGNNERALRKIAKYTSYEDEIMKRYRDMEEKKLDRIKDEKARLNYLWDNYNKKVKWWEFFVPFYGLYAAVEEYKAEKELYKEIAEKVKSGKISDKAVEEKFGKRKANRIMRKYSGEGARKGERESIFRRMKKGISGMGSGISRGLKDYFVKSTENSISESDNSRGNRIQTGIKKREESRGIFSRMKSYFGRRSGESSEPINISEYLDLTEDEDSYELVK